MSLAAAQFSPPVTGICRSVRETALPRQSELSTRRLFPVYPEIKSPATSSLRKSPYLVAKAIEQRRDTAGSESESEATPSTGESGSGDKEVEISAIGAEIKAAMEQRKTAEEDGKGNNELLSGVAEEVREIEWPAFQKVLGTTGVVLGVIAGSSVVLLTVNFILAELSDRVFVGKGVQDFFG